MAGIASNPGTTEKYIFRYQYLLVEVGGQILRSIFDLQVGKDLMRYLSANNKEYKQLMYLINKDIIKGEQQSLLPPLNSKPCSKTFDITLTCCLLRNICGLKRRDDTVWIPPVNNADFSMEADITRIREYRNILDHRPSVFISEAEYEQKWKDLCVVLNRLNIFAKINDLSDQIDAIKHCEIDENLKKKLEDVIKQWNESEKLLQLEIEGLKLSQSELKEDLSKCEETVQTQGKTLQQHETTLQDHGTTLKDNKATLQDHGTALKGHVTTLQDYGTTLKDHGTTLQDHGTTLQDHGTTLQDHGTTLQDHGKTLQDHGTTQQDHGTTLLDHGTTLQDHGTTLQDHGTTLLDHGTTLQDHETTLQDHGTTLQDHGTTLKDNKATLQDHGTTLHDYEARLQDQGTTLQDHGTALQDITYQLDTLKDFDQRKQGRNDQEEIKLINDATALKTYLIKTYKETCSTLPVTALSEKDDEIELLEFYQPLEMKHKPYHKSTEDDKEYEISSFKEIFYKGEHCFKHIFLTAEAGQGKSSLCQCMTLLWSKVQADETINNNYFQENSAFMKQFDFVFHISLRDTYRDYILTMIVDLLKEFNDNEDELKKLLTYISEQYNCLIILDGLDEWTPLVRGSKPQTLPCKLQSDKCIYLTACRPYKIENERLKKIDIDRQVHIFGMSDNENYVKAVIQYVNKTRRVQGDVRDFSSEIERCGLSDHLHIPVITSQLILVWFKQKLTNMSRAVIYGNFVEMLFERADKKESVKLSQSQSCDLQFPESFKELIYIRKYASLIEKVCLLAFGSLFKQDDNVSVLVFTSKKLMSEPYCITNEEMDFLCKLGILSKDKVIGNVGERKLKLSFLHKSFIEFYAAMYVSFFDKKDDFHSVIIRLTELKEIFEYENFLLLLSGLCHQKVSIFLDTIYNSLLEDIQACRDAFISDYLINERNNLVRVQNLVIKLFIEIRTHVDQTVSLKLDDFYFYTNHESLKQLLLLNKTNVKCLYSDTGIFHDEFNQICNLQHIYICCNICPPSDIIDPPSNEEYDDRFNRLMLQNTTTLHTVCIKNTGGIFTQISLSKFSVRDLHYLTSLCLCNVVVPHKCLHDIADHLSNNVNIQSLYLEGVECGEHDITDSNCLHRTNLQHSCNIKYLEMSDVNIIVSNINTTSLKSVTLCPSSDDIFRSYIDLFKYLESSKLEYLKVYTRSHIHFGVGTGKRLLDFDIVNQLLDTLKTLSCITNVKLHDIVIPDNKDLLLHSDVTQVEIKLDNVRMSDKCFLSFVQYCTSKKAKIDVKLYHCTIIKHDRDNYRHLSHVLAPNNESLPDNEDLLLHSDVTKVGIKLIAVTMSDKCFLSFVQYCTSKKANIVVELFQCTIIEHDGDDYRDLLPDGDDFSINDSWDDGICLHSWDYMYQHLRSIPNVIITEARCLGYDSKLKFETRNSYILYTRYNGGIRN